MFDLFLPIILKFEGGYSNNKNDPGKATNFGVTQETYTHYLAARELPWRAVKEITHEEVENIYKGYWRGSGADKIEQSHPHTSLCIFDCAINQGPGTAKFLLQRAINKCWGIEKITVDGSIGPKTLEALKDIHDNALLKEYLEIRKVRYDQLLLTRPTMLEFKSSWYNRLNVVAKYGELDWVCK